MTQIAGNAYVQITDKSVGQKTNIDANTTKDEAKGFTEPVQLGTMFGSTQTLYVSPTAKVHLDKHATNPNVELTGGQDAGILESLVRGAFNAPGASQQGSQSSL